MATGQLHEAELAQYLREDPAFFLEALNEFYGSTIVRYIKHIGRGYLAEQDLADTYQNTILGLWERVQKDKFDPERPLRMVYAIAKNKTLDALRKRRHNPQCSEESILDIVRNDLSGTEASFEWRKKTGAERAEFRAELEDCIRELPPQQRLVATVFIDTFEDVRANSFRAVAEAVAKITGRPQKVVTVRSAWREACKKIRKRLAQKGISLEEGKA